MRDEIRDVKNYNLTIIKFLIVSVLFFGFVVSPSFSDELSAKRSKMLEDQAEAIGITNIDTYKRVFAANMELYRVIASKTGTVSDFYGLSFHNQNKDYHHLVKRNDNFSVTDYHPENDYLFTVPVIYDYCVMISRISEQLEVTNDIEDKICATFSSDIITGEWCKDMGITKYDRDNVLASSACQKILTGEADFMFMPQRLAEIVFDIMNYGDDLYMSRPFFEFSYCFVFEKNQIEQWEIVNNVIIDMIQSGELETICNKYGLTQSFTTSENIQYSLLFYVIIFLLIALGINILILLLTVKNGTLRKILKNE